jgi:phage tail sheath protein FI
MSAYLRPGAYTERVDAVAANRVLIRSDIAAFIGIAEKGPLDTPVPIESFRQFQAHFGNFIGAAYLAYSVRAYFDNGGKRCWVVRVAARDFNVDARIGPYFSGSGLGAKSAQFTLNDAVQPVWTIAASSEGVWGNNLAVNIIEENRADTTIAAGAATPFYAEVATVAGFTRGTLLAISQEDSTGALQNFHRVVSFIDLQRKRLYWQHPEAGQGLPYDQPLTALDGNRPARVASISYRISVSFSGRFIAQYVDVSLVPEHDNYGPRLLPEPTYEEEQKGRRQLAVVPAPVIIHALKLTGAAIPLPLNLSSIEAIPLAGGSDGLQYLSPQDFIGEAFTVDDSDAQRSAKNRGLASLNQVDEITLIAIPDIVIQPEPDPVYQVQAALVEHCEMRGDRFAIIEPPFHSANDAASGIAAISAWRKRFESSYAALYYPWLKVIEPRATDTVRAIPPSGHALGQYALLDNEIGVHRAPANRPLNWIQDITAHTRFGEQEILNPLGVNVFRSEGPRGLRIMGARTVSSDPDWRYINVRRLLIMIRKTLHLIAQWVVFEPNDAVTRNKFQVAISSYLNELWIRGALNGETAEQAYFVKCDEDNNPAWQRDNGWLLAEIGVAPSYPFEFIIVRVGLQENELEITESGDFGRAA